MPKNRPQKYRIYSILKDFLTFRSSSPSATASQTQVSEENLSRSMTHKLIKDSSRKRKLSYDEDDFMTLNQYVSPEKKITRPSIKKRFSVGQDADWNRCMEGFSDYTPKQHGQERKDMKETVKRSASVTSRNVASAWQHLREAKLIKEKNKLQTRDHDPNLSLEICDWSDEEKVDDNISDHAESSASPARIPLPCPPKSSIKTLKPTKKPDDMAEDRLVENDEDRYSIECSTASCEPPSQLHQADSEFEKHEVEEGNISTFNSEDEICEEDDDLDEEIQAGVTDSLSPNISGTFSDPSQGIQGDLNDDGNPAARGVKGSDLLKKLSEVTPTKGVNDNHSRPAGEESGKKKKKKYVKFGLFEQLHRLQAREKSAFTFWSHKKQVGQQASTKVLKVRILSTESKYSLMSTSAVEITEDEDTESSSSPKLQVLFTRTRAQQLQLAAGCEVLIQPPWQTLDQPDSQGRVILCTNYSTVISRQGAVPSSTPSSVMRRLLYTWTCCCQEDPTVYPDSCHGEVKQTTVENVKPGRPKQGAVEDRGSKPHGLQCVNATQFVPSGRGDSILDCIERQGGGTKNASVNFTATVMRVICRNQVNNLNRPDGNKNTPPLSKYLWSLLLQDVYGAICEVSIHDSELHPWKDIVTKGEGCQYRFQNLLIHHRTNREKTPALFSMIDSLWTPEKFQSRSQSQEDSTQESQVPSCPNFCYILSSAQAVVHEQDQPTTIYAIPRLQSLSETHKVSESCRVSFKAKILHLEKGEKSGDTMSVYVTDPSIAQSDTLPPYIHVQIQSSCRHHQSSSDNVLDRTGFGKNATLVFHDVWKLKEKFLADAYSKILPGTHEGADTSEYWSEFQLRLPALVERCCEGMLVSVQGKIQEVDEDSAYSWPACDKCGSDKLVYQSKLLGTLFCNECQKPVQKPVNRMKLDVYVKSPDPSLENLLIKAELSQSTIESFLPEEADEEGYDIQCVLERDIGPLTCIITSVHRNKQLRRKMIHLKEVQLSL